MEDPPNWPINVYENKHQQYTNQLQKEKNYTIFKVHFLEKLLKPFVKEEQLVAIGKCSFSPMLSKIIYNGNCSSLSIFLLYVTNVLLHVSKISLCQNSIWWNSTNCTKQYCVQYTVQYATLLYNIKCTACFFDSSLALFFWKHNICCFMKRKKKSIFKKQLCATKLSLF